MKRMDCLTQQMIQYFFGCSIIYVGCERHTVVEHGPLELEKQQDMFRQGQLANGDSPINGG